LRQRRIIGAAPILTTQTKDIKPSWLNHLAVALPLIALGVAMLLLALPLRLPTGPMYWDNFIYIDGAYRVLSGQTPSVDFFAPVGPLAYWLSAIMLWLFPNGQTVLLSSYALLLVTVPLMALAMHDVSRRDKGTALALLAVFLFYALVPFNTSSYYPFPGADGFGIYNRQGSQLLYVLVTAVLFIKGPRMLVALISFSMAALFLIKITAFLAGGLICLFALISGRVTIKPAIIAAFVFVAIVGLVEFTSGAVSAYVGDIIALVKMNSGGLAGRMLQSASRMFAVSAATVLLALVLFPTKQDLKSRKLNQPAFWLPIVLLAGLFFESQNTGGQELIFLWPAILSAMPLMMKKIFQPKVAAPAFALAAIIVLVPFANTTQAAARAIIGMVKHERLEFAGMKSLDNLTARPENLKRAEFMRGEYAGDQADLKDFAKAGELPSPLLYSDPDFQIAWLKSASDAVVALQAAEARGFTYNTIMTLDFTNPFPFLTGKQATKHIAIGADPFRAVPEPDAETNAAVADTDAILIPLCPYTAATRDLEAIYAKAMAGRNQFNLTPCHAISLKAGVILLR
jgi:hypothetical protein